MANAPPPWVECPTCGLRYRDRGDGCPRCAEKDQGPLGSSDPGDARVTQWSAAPPEPPAPARSFGKWAVLGALVLVGTCVKLVAPEPSGARGPASSATSAGGTEPIPVGGEEELNANSLRLTREEFMSTCQQTWKDPFDCGCLTATVYDELGSEMREKLLRHQLTSAEQTQVNKIASRNCGHPTQVTIIRVGR